MKELAEICQTELSRIYCGRRGHCSRTRVPTTGRIVEVRSLDTVSDGEVTINNGAFYNFNHLNIYTSEFSSLMK